MDQRDIQINENSVLRSTEVYNNLDVISMDRKQLLQFLYDYIQKSQYLNKRNSLINTRLTENNLKRSKRLTELKNKFDAFYNNNLMTNQKNIEKIIKNRKQIISKFRRRIFNYNNNIKYRYLILLIFLIFWIPFEKSLLFSLLIAPFIAVPIRWILKPLEYLLRPLGNNFMKLFDSLLIKIAQKQDLSVAKKKGITPDNIKKVFKFDEIKEEIENEFNNLEKQIRSWKYNESIGLKNELSILKRMILNEEMKLDYIIYMYEQLYIGAVDNWKEAINDLKNQLKHEELKNELRIVNENIKTSNRMLVEMNEKMNRQFSQLDSMISTQFDRIDDRLDGLYENGYYYHY